MESRSKGGAACATTERRRSKGSAANSSRNAAAGAVGSPDAAAMSDETANSLGSEGEECVHTSTVELGGEERDAAPPVWADMDDGGSRHSACSRRDTPV